MKIKSILINCIAALMLTACASPATVENMVLPVSADSPNFAQSPFKENVRLANVAGGEETNPLWTSEVGNTEFKEALEQSLTNFGLNSKNETQSKFELYAKLEELDQPIFGINLTVDSSIDYKLVETGSRKVWYNKKVPAQYTATFGDSVIAIQRLRLANEGSIRENIKTFFEELSKVKQPVP